MKITIGELRDVIKESLLHSMPWHYVDNYLEKLGFYKVLGANDYDGHPRYTIAEYAIKLSEYTPEVEKQVKELLNRCGWRIFKQGDGMNYIEEVPYMYIYIEAVHGSEMVNGDRIFYHATPSNKVQKILKNGLCPRDEGKRGDYRGARIYLSMENNQYLFHSLFGNDDYEVFIVDLCGSGIKVYEDEYADDSVYVTENIPPDRLKLTTNLGRCENNKRKEVYKLIDERIVQPYNLKWDHDSIKGVINGTAFNFLLSIFPWAHHGSGDYEVQLCKHGKKWYLSNMSFNTSEKLINWMLKHINNALKEGTQREVEQQNIVNERRLREMIRESILRRLVMSEGLFESKIRKAVRNSIKKVLK